MTVTVWKYPKRDEWKSIMARPQMDLISLSRTVSDLSLIHILNVPQKKLNDVLSVLPGIKSPTVMPLADQEWCSVHTVLDEKCFWEIINLLKTAGAEGILVLDIEKMIL